MRSNVGASRRKFELLAASCLVPLSLGVSEPARAQSCSPVNTPGTLTAAQPSTMCTGTFNTNITFGGPTTGPPSLAVTLNPGVSVTSPGGGAVALSNANVPTANGTSTTINANGTAANPIFINNTANPGGANNWGLVNQPGSAGAAVINATNTQIDVNGTAGSNAGIWAISYGTSLSNVASVTYNAGVTAGITSSGSNSTGIQAENRGNGNASIDASGNISGSVGTPGGFTFLGLDGLAGSTLGGGAGGPGDASVIYRSGTINVLGNFTAGLFASANIGSATITTLPGTSIIVSQQFSTDTLQPGVDAFSTNGNTTDTVASTILINGNPAVPTTNYKSNPTGIRASSDLSGDASVTYSGPQHYGPRWRRPRHRCRSRKPRRHNPKRQGHRGCLHGHRADRGRRLQRGRYPRRQRLYTPCI